MGVLRSRSEQGPTPGSLWVCSLSFFSFFSFFLFSFSFFFFFFFSQFLGLVPFFFFISFWSGGILSSGQPCSIRDRKEQHQDATSGAVAHKRQRRTHADRSLRPRYRRTGPQRQAVGVPEARRG